jgi:hypothetical protein
MVYVQIVLTLNVHAMMGLMGLTVAQGDVRMTVVITVSVGKLEGRQFVLVMLGSWDQIALRKAVLITVIIMDSVSMVNAIVRLDSLVNIAMRKPALIIVTTEELVLRENASVHKDLMDK